MTTNATMAPGTDLAPNQQPDIISASLEQIKGGAGILVHAQTRVAKATEMGNNLLARIALNSGALDADLDQEANTFISNCNRAKAEMENARKPITQMLAIISKEYILQEKALDHAEPGSIAHKVQQHRHAYARKVAEDAAAEQRRLDAERRQGIEKVELEAEAKRQLAHYCATYLLQEKQAMQRFFDELTLETLEAAVDTLQGFAVAYPYSHFMAFAEQPVRHVAVYHKPEAVQAIFTGVVNGTFQEYADTFTTSMTALRDQLIAALPGKAVELEQLAQADEDMKAQMLKRQEEMAADNQQRISDEVGGRYSAQLQQLEAEKQADKTEVLFNTTSAVNLSGPETRSSYELEVTDVRGWPLVMALWFEQEGIKATGDLSKKNLGQMAKFCADHAHGGGHMIQSPYLTYKPVYKAVTKTTRSKKA